MRKSIFTIDGFEPSFVGYTDGTLWNGWAKPYFTKEVADQIMYANNADGNGTRMIYDVKNDKYIRAFDGEPTENWEVFDGYDIDGMHLYDIGNMCWIWDEFDNRDKRYFAQEVDEWLHEYDECAYEDYHGNRDVAQMIFDKFADIDILAQTIKIMNDTNLDENEIYTKLEEALAL